MYTLFDFCLSNLKTSSYVWKLCEINSRTCNDRMKIIYKLNLFNITLRLVSWIQIIVNLLENNEFTQLIFSLI